MSQHCSRCSTFSERKTTQRGLWTHRAFVPVRTSQIMQSKRRWCWRRKRSCRAPEAGCEAVARLAPSKSCRCLPTVTSGGPDPRQSCPVPQLQSPACSQPAPVLRLLSLSAPQALESQAGAETWGSDSRQRGPEWKHHTRCTLGSLPPFLLCVITSHLQALFCAQAPSPYRPTHQSMAVRF